METLKQRIHALASPLQLIHVATLDGDRPKVRPVVGKADEDLLIRFSTHLDSDKVGQMRANPQVHITLGAKDPMSQTWLQIDGLAEVSTERAEREAFWFDQLRAYVSGVDDPRYSVVIIRPSRIELHQAGRPQPEIWQP